MAKFNPKKKQQKMIKHEVIPNKSVLKIVDTCIVVSRRFLIAASALAS